ncbi:hypothetical protein IKJ53_06615, partial [bacterium]|nr:hypothetical protein [bacterium]
IDAINVGGNVGNAGTISLTGSGENGYLNYDISGIGTTTINGQITSFANIDQKIAIDQNNSLTINADNLLGAEPIKTVGTLCLTGGTLGRYVFGNGYANITGDVVSNAQIQLDVGGVNIANDASLTIDADKLLSNTTNDGTLNLVGSELNTLIFNNTISGAGVTNVSKNVGVINGSIHNRTINILDGAWFEINADSLTVEEGGSVINSGTLVFTGGNLSTDVQKGNPESIVFIGNGTGVGSYVTNTDDRLIQALRLDISAVSTFTTKADVLYGVDLVNNAGGLYLSGNLSRDVAGSGTTYIDGSLTSLGNNEISGKLNLNNGSLSTNTVDEEGVATSNKLVLGSLAGNGSYSFDIIFGDTGVLIDTIEVGSVDAGTSLTIDNFTIEGIPFGTSTAPLITSTNSLGNLNVSFANSSSSFDNYVHVYLGKTYLLDLSLVNSSYDGKNSILLAVMVDSVFDGGGIVSKIKSYSQDDLLSTLKSSQRELSTESGDGKVGMYINGVKYYYTLSPDELEDVYRYQSLANVGSSALVETNDRAKAMFSVGGKYYYYDKDLLSESVYYNEKVNLGEGDYSYYWEITQNGVELTGSSRKINIIGQALSSDNKVVWLVNDTAPADMSQTVEVDILGRKTYLTYFPNADADMSKIGVTNPNVTFIQNSVDKLTGDFVNLTKKGSTSGLILLNGNGVLNSLNANFIGNKYTATNVLSSVFVNTLAKINNITGSFIANEVNIQAAGIFNSGTIGTITGDFISNKGDLGSAIFNRENGTIDSITGDFISNVSAQSGGAIYNQGTINSIEGNFIGNYASSHGGAIANIGATLVLNNTSFYGNYAG